MSDNVALITRCPACQTRFKISQAQLGQHQGFVKCGQCRRVFNAKEHLQRQVKPAEVYNPVIEAAKSVVEPHAAPSPTASPTTQPNVEQDKLTAEMLVTEGVSNAPIDPIAPQYDAVTDALLLAHAQSIEESAVARTEQDRAAAETQGFAPTIQERLPEVDDLDNQNTTVRKKNTGWWLVLATLLAIAAIAQAVYFLRSQIAAQLPQSKPYLQQACGYLGCTVDLPREIDLLVLDDHDMQTDDQHENVVHLKCTISNRAFYAMAYPNLEVTFTDADSKAIIRRDLKPAEYLSAGTDVAKGLPAHDDVHCKLVLQINGESASGYKLNIYYP